MFEKHHKKCPTVVSLTDIIKSCSTVIPVNTTVKTLTFLLCDQKVLDVNFG